MKSLNLKSIWQKNADKSFSKEKSVGVALATKVTDKLDKEYALKYSHREYCGMGLWKEEDTYIYDSVFDGEGITKAELVNHPDYRSKERQEFNNREEFIQWLSRQTDESFSGDFVEEFDRNNQRITIIRLQFFADGTNQPLDEMLWNIKYDEAMMREASEFLCTLKQFRGTWIDNGVDYVIKHFETDNNDIEGLRIDDNYFTLKIIEDKILRRYWDEIPDMWEKSRFWILHWVSDGTGYFLLLPFGNMPVYLLEFVRSRLQPHCH